MKKLSWLAPIRLPRSPDGEWIAFGLDQDAIQPLVFPTRFYRVHPDGTNLTPLTNNSQGIAAYPVWDQAGGLYYSLSGAISDTDHQRSRAAPKSPFVFVDEEGGDYASEGARARISHHAKKAMVEAGIADASFHTLRHTAAAWMVQDGVPLYEVPHVLGHSTPVLTQRYAHHQPEHLRRAVNALDKKLKASGERNAAEKGQK